MRTLYTLYTLCALRTLFADPTMRSLCAMCRFLAKCSLRANWRSSGATTMCSYGTMLSCRTSTSLPLRTNATTYCYDTLRTLCSMCRWRCSPWLYAWPGNLPKSESHDENVPSLMFWINPNILGATMLCRRTASAAVRWESNALLCS
jgi:hypothetical protein